MVSLESIPNSVLPPERLPVALEDLALSHRCIEALMEGRRDDLQALLLARALLGNRHAYNLYAAAWNDRYPNDPLTL